MRMAARIIFLYFAVFLSSFPVIVVAAISCVRCCAGAAFLIGMKLPVPSLSSLVLRPSSFVKKKKISRHGMEGRPLVKSFLMCFILLRAQ